MMTRIGRRFVDAFLLGVAVLTVTVAPVAAQTFSSGSTGADDSFSPTCTPTPCTVTVTLPPSGIFHFTTITVPSGVTVQFTRNVSNTPVIMLATGAVSISGTINVSGGAGGAGVWGLPGVGGPGGFDGGAGAWAATGTSAGFGLGPGGGGGGTGGSSNYGGAGGGGGGYLTAGTAGYVPTTGCAACTAGVGGLAYGSTFLRPILGGSGGGGGGAYADATTIGGGGGGGGGAILIASSVSIGLYNSTGYLIRADGGMGSDSNNYNGGRGGGGAGGAIRLIAPVITGAGYLSVYGGSTNSGNYAGYGAYGRIRLEATTLSYTGNVSSTASVGPPQPVFPGTGQPTLTIASVGGVAAPVTPLGTLMASPDIIFPMGTTNPVEVGFTARNIPLGTAIQVTANPQSGAKTSTVSSGLTGTLESSTATASLMLSLTQTSVLTATATYPLIASTGEGPLYADGEEVTHIKVAALLGGGSAVTYITRSGREVRVQ